MRRRHGFMPFLWAGFIWFCQYVLASCTDGCTSKKSAMMLPVLLSFWELRYCRQESCRFCGLYPLPFFASETERKQKWIEFFNSPPRQGFRRPAEALLQQVRNPVKSRVFKGITLKRVVPFLYIENPTLGVGFRKAYSYECEIKTPFARTKRPDNSIESKRRSFPNDKYNCNISSGEK